MILKNKEIVSISNALKSIGDSQKDVKLRFDLSKKIKPITQEVDGINNEIQKLIKDKHEEDNEITSISIYDEDYISLMEYENTIDFKGLKLDYLSLFNPTMEQLIALEKIIIE